MKVSGTATLSAPVERVWDALQDPAVLVRTIPGCERLEEVGPDRYRMTVTAGVASIKGSYTGEVALTEQQHPSSFVLKASGAGAPGTVSADVIVTLADDGGSGTRLTYDADAVVGGPVGGVGQRVLAGVAKKTAGEFFRAVDGVLTGAVPAPREPVAAAADLTTTAPAAAPGQGAATPDAPSDTKGRVFAAPTGVGQGAGGVRERSPGALGGVLAGAVVALAGVWVGFRLARSGSRG